MKVSEYLYSEAACIWEGYHRHPFITGMGRGDLPVEKFRFFMLQDYLYLFDYAKVFALGVVKSRDPALMASFSRSLDHILNGEMNIHKEYMARLGITKEEVRDAKMSLVNSSYTNYMLSVSFAGGPAEILAAILACSWSYQEIGCRLAAIPGAADHPFYGVWIQGYSSDDYIRENAKLMEMTDKAAGDYTKEQLSYLAEVFVNCSRYEAQFWDMSYHMEM